jgi:hypothetical protein
VGARGGEGEGGGKEGRTRGRGEGEVGEISLLFLDTQTDFHNCKPFTYSHLSPGRSLDKY